MNRTAGKSQPRGFSLMELMIVAAILAVLLGLAVPTLQKSTQASSLTSAGETIVGNLALAQQIANVRNRQVEVRFYQLPGDQNTLGYRAFQLFRIEPEGAKAVTKVIRFPQFTAFASTADKTSLLNLPVQSATASSPALPRQGTNYKYLSFKFKPTGETDLDTSAKWFLTLVLENDPVRQIGLPANFLTVQINPVSGKPTVFRP
ncbi:MAG: Verru_Chthon cassette protein D [Chthoniobacteraceae bacterium]